MKEEKDKLFHTLILIPLFLFGISFYSSASFKSGIANSLFSPAAPTALPATTIATTSFDANWNAVLGAVDYRIDVSTNPSFSSFVFGYNDLTVAGTSINVSGLVPGQTYYYRVRAYDGFGFSIDSNTINITTITDAPVLVSPSNVTSTSFRANWIFSNGANSYELDVASDASFTTLILNSQPVSTTYYNVAGLSAGNTYYYRVRAVTSGGSSNNSTEENITTIPSAPVAIAASLIHSSDFTANWNAVSGASEYRLDLSLYSSFSSFIPGYADYSVASNSLVISGLVEGQTYYYRVRAISSGGSSNNSNTITCTTVPLAPVANSASSIVGSSFTANWGMVSGATEYRLDVADNSGFSPNLAAYSDKPVTGTSSSVSGLTSTQTYYYRVRAHSGGGDSDNSNIIMVPGSPIAISANGSTTTSFIANWSPVSDALEYRLDVATDATFSNILSGYNNLQVSTSSVNVSGLIEGQNYYYRVRAVANGGTSINSNTINITTIPLAPTADPATGITVNQFTANWQTSTGAASYRLDVAIDASFTSLVVNDMTVSGLSKNVTGLSGGQTYYYRVRAVSSGGASSNSGVISLITIPQSPIATSATSISTTQFTANWGSVTGAVDYELDVATNNTFTTLVVNSLVTTSNNAIINSLTAGTTYYYRVRARNSGGTSNSSSTITVVTTPPAPTTIAASPVTTTSFTAKWNSTTGATSYLLDVASDIGFTSYILNGVSVSGTSKLVNGLSPGTKYYYKIKAVNSGGTTGYSNVTTVSTITDAPVASAATLILANGFTANWQSTTGATSYQLDVSLNSSFSPNITGYNSLTVSDIKYAVTGLGSGQTYYYRVRGVNASGSSVSSSPAISVITLCGQPVANSAISVTANSFTARWNPVSGATSYFVDVATDPTFSSILSGYNGVSTSSTSYNVTGLNEGTSYYYRVRATNSSGTGANSSYITVVTIPPSPSALSASNVSQASFTANWSTASGASSYLLDVSTDSLFSSFVAPYNNYSVVGTSLSITSLSSGTVYYYRVRASNSNGTSSYSSTISVTTIPNPPTALASTDNIGSSFTANWSSVSAATSYRLDVSTNSSFSSYLAGYNDKIVSGVSDLVNGLSANQTYYYRIRSVNASGASSNSNIIIVPGAPVATNSSGNSISSFVANWNSVTDAVNYRLDVATDIGFTSLLASYNNLSVSSTAQTVAGLSSGTNYYYRVRAVTSGGTSINSNIITTKTISVAPLADPATSITNNSFIANWETTTGASSYKLDVATDAGFSSILTDYNNLDVSGTSQTVTQLLSGQNYYYRVRAVNSGGTSQNSNVINLTTIPVAPTANAGSNILTTSFTASWNAVSGALNYAIDVSTDSTFATFLTGYNNKTITAPTPPATPSASISSLTAGIKYFYRVRAVSSAGSSLSSNVIAVVTVPGAPSGLVAGAHTSSSFLLDWNSVTGAIGYKVDISTVSNFASFVGSYNGYNVSTDSLTITGLNAGTRYYYRVRAFSSGGTGINSTASNTLTVPPPPVAKAASSITNTGFVANWNAATGAVKYKLEVALLPDFSAGLQEFDNITGLTYSVTGLTAGPTYYYRVKAINSINSATINGISSGSNVIIVPGIPVAINPTSLTSNSFIANWNPVNGATNYRLEVFLIPSATRVPGYEDVVVNSTQQLVTGLTAGNSYSYIVRAESNGGVSTYSNSIVVPAAPTASAAVSITKNSFEAGWTVVQGASEYRIDVSNLPEFPAGSFVGYEDYPVAYSSTNIAISGLSPGNTYYYRVRAVGSCASLNSNVISVVTTPAAPVAVASSNISSTSFYANWNSTIGATSYRLDVSDNSSFSTFIGSYQDYPIAGTSANITGLITGNTYYYRVRAVNSGGTSSNSNVITAKTGAVIVTAPNLLGICTNSNYVNLGDIVIAEGSNDVFIPNTDSVTFILSIPSGFELMPDNGLATKVQGDDISSGIDIQVSPSTISLKYLVTTTSGVEDVFKISDLKIRAVGSAASGNIKRTGGTAEQAGNNVVDNIIHGTLSSNNTTPASIIGLETNYCVNGNPVTLAGSPEDNDGPGGVVGIFSGRGMSGNVFTPANAGVGFDTIYYSYTNLSGCTYTFSKIIYVNELPEIDFYLNNKDTAVCVSEPFVTLNGTPNGGIFVGPGVGQNSTGGYNFYPSNAKPGVHEISYTYTTSANCQITLKKNIYVNPEPVADFTLSDFCDGKTITFTDVSTVTSGSIIDWSWNFGDNSQDTVQNPTHIYAFDGSFSVSLTVRTSSGCTSSKTIKVNIGKTPAPIFSWENSCFGNAVKFEDITGIDETIVERTWDFNDGTTSNDSTPEHIFPSPGVYNVKLTIRTNANCIEDSTFAVPIFPYISTFPYSQDFEQDNTGWVSGGDNSSWVIGTPNGTIINKAYSGSRAWVTNVNGTYNDNEKSFIEGPCFNLTGLVRPMVSFKIWYDTDKGADGAVLQASLDDGKTWEVVGNLNEGLGWYDSSPIIGGPGGQQIMGWSGRDLPFKWREAKFKLDRYKAASSVRFRIAFGSSSENPANSDYNGVAIDDFWIGERNHKVLVEHFVNNTTGLTEAEAISTMVSETNDELIDLHYHTNFPAQDEVNLKNPSDPSARALFYSVSQVPQSILDGNYKIKNFSIADTTKFQSYSLKEAKFEVQLTFDESDAQKLGVDVKVNALDTILADLVMQTVIVQEHLENGHLMKVLTKMLPDASGTVITKKWNKGDEENYNFTWIPKYKIEDEGIGVLVFIQNKKTKEIYQAIYKKSALNPDVITGKDDLLPPGAVTVYPNPAKTEVTLQIHQLMGPDLEYELIDVLGKNVLNGAIKQGEQNSRINLKNLTSGVYSLQLKTRGELVWTKKIIIAR